MSSLPRCEGQLCPFCWHFEELYIGLGFECRIDWRLVILIHSRFPLYNPPQTTTCKLLVIKIYTICTLHATVRGMHIFPSANWEIYLICIVIKVIAVQILVLFRLLIIKVPQNFDWLKHEHSKKLDFFLSIWPEIIHKAVSKKKWNRRLSSLISA